MDRRAMTEALGRLALGVRRLDPRCLGFLQFRQSLPRCVTKSRAEMQVWDIGNVSFIFLIIEYVEL